ncbi:DNA-binding transcriptional regulator, LysR family [Paenibacillus algorifonticola]|uniref:DNA-binding transcriptional regulator, LysR family n=1 Tax=Paenibacillus algorifonticola TaxID=684063 RepID=A0A1I2FZU6_9BACL|nr:LysR family transcriptional regulator [Paenibacillus algorifonticola]SFF10934.1 DNA-binding transcriptional regulator, LysR family [Paenibacillus algorifonticola]
MNIENIEAFVYVIYYGSFNKAAESLFLSQPSVTARIQSLERELDCKLFDRMGKQIQLTEEGKRFLPYAQQILQTLEKGRKQLHQKQEMPAQLRLGCTVSTANYLVPRLLPALKEKHPGIRFKTVTAPTDDIVEKVLNKEVDIGFVRQTTHPGLRSVKLLDDAIRLHVYEGHPFLKEKQITLRAIGNQPLVFFECGALDWVRLQRVFESLNEPPEMSCHTDNLETAKRLVLQKLGICFLPSLSAYDEVQAGQLFPITIPEVEGLSLDTNLIMLNGESSPFFESLVKLVKALPFVSGT